MKKYIQLDTDLNGSAIDPNNYGTATDLYIDILDNYPEYQEAENLAADVPYAEGHASFWQLRPNVWKLVIFNEDEYNPDTYVYENDPYWGTEELIPSEVNDIELSSEELYATLAQLPGVDLDDLYGLREVLDDFEDAFSNFI